MKIENVEFIAGVASLTQLPKARLPEVAFLGPSNVGKSSLLNALVGKRGLARVSKTPGRTQQLNFFRVDGRFDLVDLPGYGFAKAPRAVQDAFRRLIESYLATSTHLRLLLLLQDCRRLPSERDLELRQWLVENRVPHALVLTKADKLGRGELAKQAAAVRKAFGPTAASVDVVAFSALEGSGRPELWKVIVTALTGPQGNG